MTGEVKSDRNPGRWILLLLTVAFLGPIAVAVLLYATGEWRASGSTVHGVLLNPPRLLPTEAGISQMRGKWTLIYLGSGHCDQSCDISLGEMRQLRRSLGKEMSRVQRVYVVTDGVADSRDLHREDPGLIVIADPSASSALVNAVGTRNEGDIFLADPLGNLVLRYPASTELKGMYEDLQRLLKASGVG